MTTRAHDVTRWVAGEWEKLYASAVLSGIAPDRRHLAAGGYHVSRQDNPHKRNYSLIRPDDRGGPDDLSAAIDMSMSPKDMRLCTARLKKVYDNPDDPRRKYINAFNGWDGTGDATRFDIWARVTSYASPDHKWHVHVEIRRRWVTSMVAARALLSALAGQSAAAYQASLTTKAEDDDMTPDELMTHRMPFTYVDAAGKKVSTYLTVAGALTKAWISGYDLRNKTLPAQAKAIAELSGTVAGITALVKTLLADDDTRIDAAQFDTLQAHISKAAGDAAAQVLKAVSADPAAPD